MGTILFREIHASLVLHSHCSKAAACYSQRRTQKHPSTMTPNVELLLSGRPQPRALLRAVLLSVTAVLFGVYQTFVINYAAAQSIATGPTVPGSHRLEAFGGYTYLHFNSGLSSICAAACTVPI